MAIDIQWINYLLLASNALLGGAAALAILRAERMTTRQESFWNSPTGAVLSLQTGPEEALKGIDRRIDALADLVKSPDPGDGRDHPPAKNVPYENAVRMAQHGASLDDLTRACGLSASEARLLMRVHCRQPQIAQAS